MELQQAINELIELGKKNGGSVTTNDIAKYFTEDKDEYDLIEKALTDAEIEINSVEEDIDDIEPVIIEEEEVDISDYDQLPSSVRVDDPVRMYLKEIGNIQLLTLEEETVYAQRVVEGREAKERLAQIEADGENESCLNSQRSRRNQNS